MNRALSGPDNSEPRPTMTTGADVLVNYPGFGSLWLWGAYLVNTPKGPYVVGETWDDSGAGSPYMPDDYTGEPCILNFPATCIRKQIGELVTRG